MVAERPASSLPEVAMGVTTEGRESRRLRSMRLLFGAGLLTLISATLAVGGWWGFPVQDDTYMIRHLRMGGPERIVSEHADRPVVGRLMAAGARIAGESRPFYIAVGVLSWLALTLEAAALWARLFPEWAFAWPAVAIGIGAPVVTMVQFTTLTTILPCVLPVVLVLASLLMLLNRPDAEGTLGIRLGAALLAAAAAVFSEYALAAMAASVTFLFLRRRWRSALTLGAGVAVGYLVFRAISMVSVRATTDPDVQIENVTRGPLGVPLKILGAAWECLIGAWGRAATGFSLDWDTRSSILAATVALAAGLGAAAVGRRREGTNHPAKAGGRLAALVAAVLAGLVPTFVIRGFPLTRVFETRYFIPVLAFASCATMGALMYASRPRVAPWILFAVVFLGVDRLVLRAFEEKRLQESLDRFGRQVRPLVATRVEDGLLILVSSRVPGVSPEETMAKATYRWPFPEAGLFWIVPPHVANNLFGPRAGCRSVRSLMLDKASIRWERPTENIRSLLWDASYSDTLDVEPYFRGCADH